MSLISESTHSQDAMPIDFKNVSKLPDSYAWTPTDHDPLLVKPIRANVQVPVIDLNASSNDTLALIRNACKEWGIFQVVNHDISIGLLEQVEFQTRKLFALPMDVKLRTIANPDALNGYAIPAISISCPKKLWTEGFRIQGSPEKEAKFLWEDQDVSKTFCDVMIKFQEEIKKLTERLMGMMIKSLGLVIEDVDWFRAIINGYMQPECTLQLNSYPVCPDPDKAMGLAPHTDTSLLTLLYQGNIGGLQVFKENVGWVPMPPMHGAIIVNTGDIMHMFTNGLFNPVLHKAIVNKDVHRISYAYFYGPPKDIKVSASMKLTDDQHPPLYPPMTYTEYKKMKRTHFTKTLEIIKNRV